MQVLVRRSGSPTGKGELSSPSVASAQASCGDVERSWHDAKQEILAKFFQSQPKSVGGGGGGGAATPARVADAARDCVAEILGRLPPLDAADAVPGGILDVDQDAEYAVDDEEPAPHRPKVRSFQFPDLNDRTLSSPASVIYLAGSMTIDPAWEMTERPHFIFTGVSFFLLGRLDDHRPGLRNY